MKSTILLTTAIFLASAPWPDSNIISEMSAGFLSAGGEYGLMASESTSNTPFDADVSSQLALESGTEIYKAATNNSIYAKAIQEQPQIN